MAQGPRSLMPHARLARVPKAPKLRPKLKLPKAVRTVLPVAASTLAITLAIFSLPTVLAVDLKIASALPPKGGFPVTVDPVKKTISENPDVEAYIESQQPSEVTAAVATAGSIFTWIASAIASSPAYRLVAASDTVFVTIHEGYRQEQVAEAFGAKLGWGPKQRAAFLTEIHTKPPTLTEGQLAPGTYPVSALASPADVHMLIYDQFMQDIGERYSTTTAQVVPVDDALTIASMLEREAAGPEDMRLISGIMWNRLFVGMNLQIDATLQYAKASATKTGSWWPKVLPKDKYIKSAYNTYQHKDLPPGPIASPSVAAVLAALNPKKTDCLFYFHDSHGVFHCSPTYEGHVKMLKQYYGQGK